MLLEQIEKDLIEAIKQIEKIKVSTLRMLKSAIHNWQIANQKEPQDGDVLAIIQKEIKARQDSVKLYKLGGRQELAKKEAREIEILKKYLPKPLSEEAIRTKVREQITQTGASGLQDIGKVMGPLMGQFKGQADGGTVSKIVKEELSGKND